MLLTSTFKITINSASMYLYGFSRNIYGRNSKNKDEKCAKEGVASVTTSGKVRKIRKIGSLRTDKCND